MTKKFISAILLALPLLYCQSLSAQDATQSLNPLSLLSEYNLQDVGLLAKPNEDGKAWGVLFQFGRNVPFDYKGDAPREETPVSGNDPKVWGKSFLMKAEGQTKYDWLTTGALGDKWTDIVALASDAPATYRGDNGGDPCPKGMHIPSYTEWVSVMPSSFAVADFTGKIGFKHTTESITIQGQTKEYEADYYSKTKNEIVGIKCSDESYLLSGRLNLRRGRLSHHTAYAGCAIASHDILVSSCTTISRLLIVWIAPHCRSEAFVL